LGSNDATIREYGLECNFQIPPHPAGLAKRAVDFIGGEIDENKPF
jgi:hypothetical protein